MIKHIPNILTCLNLIIGCVGIYYVLTIGESSSFYFVVVAGVFDFLDGLTARALKVQSAVGKQLDSLSDLISFGLLPSFYMLQLLEAKSEYFWIAILISVFSAIRLAIFNVDSSQSDSFRGLPTPANAIMLTSLGFLPFELHEFTLLSICIFSSLILVSPVRLIALKFVNTAWKGNEARWILILGLASCMIVFKWTFIPFLIPLYIVVSVISNIIIMSR